jgi:hypothetical protein
VQVTEHGTGSKCSWPPRSYSIDHHLSCETVGALPFSDWYCQNCESVGDAQGKEIDLTATG